MARSFLGRLDVSCHKLKLTDHATQNRLGRAGRRHGSRHRAEVDALNHGTELSLDADLDTLHAAPSTTQNGPPPAGCSAPPLSGRACTCRLMTSTSPPTWSTAVAGRLIAR